MPAIWLAECTQSRDNNTKLLRHAAALAVVAFHSFALTNHFVQEPLWRVFPETNLGLLGVQIFFVLSGFLITQSWMANPRLRIFAVARILRIYPALFAATFFTILLAGYSSTLPWTEFLRSPQTRHYLLHTASAIDVTELLPGAFTTNPYPRAANGSLWTLPVELRLYAVIAVAGIVGLLRRCRLWAIVIVAITVVLAVRPDSIPIRLRNDSVLSLASLFVLASAAYSMRSRILILPSVAGICVLLYVWNPFGYVRGALALPMLVYVVLVVAYHPRLRWRTPTFNGVGDYSYGIYVYTFPIQQTVTMLWPSIDPWTLFGAALPLGVTVAAASWHWIEAPALGLKRRLTARATMPK